MREVQAAMVAETLTFSRPGKVLLVKRELGALEASEVLIKSASSLISNGTERIAYTGGFSRSSHWGRWITYPFTPGYSLAGTVLAVGKAVTHLQPGQWVVTRTAHASLVKAPATACFSFPDVISPTDAAWFALSRIGFLGAYAANPKTGQTSLVIGSGPIAQMLVRWLRILGTGKLDLVSRSEYGIAKAIDAGVENVLHGHTHDFTAAEVQNQLGRAPHFIFDCTADPAVLPWALEVVANYGRVILIGDPGVPEKRVLTGDILLKGLSVTGVHDGNTFGKWTDEHFATLFFEKLRKRQLDLSGLCTHHVLGTKAQDAYSMLAGNVPGVLGIQLLW